MVSSCMLKMSPQAGRHAINMRASAVLAVSWKRVWKEAENGFYFRLPSFATNESQYQAAGRLCVLVLAVLIRDVIRWV